MLSDMLCDYKGTTHSIWDSSPCCHPAIIIISATANGKPTTPSAVITKSLRNTVSSNSTFNLYQILNQGQHHTHDTYIIFSKTQLYIVATRLELCTYMLYNSKGYIFEGVKSEVVPAQLIQKWLPHTRQRKLFLYKLRPLFYIGR